MITGGGDIHTTNHCLELDKWMGPVVKIGGTSLATGAEVGIVAYGTLVAVSDNVRGLAIAKRSIAVDTMVASLVEVSNTDLTNWLIYGNKAMSWVDERGIVNTSGAVIPIWTVEALVADTIDVLVTAVTYGMMACVPAWLEKRLCQWIQCDALNSRCESMLWVVTVLETNVARNAKIKIVTSGASDKAFLRKLYEIQLGH